MTTQGTTMAGTTPVPQPKAVRDMLCDLLGRTVDVAPAPPFAPSHTDRGSYAVYVDDRLVIRAVAVSDVPFSAYAGAAIGLVPAGGAADAIEERVLPAAIAENLYEVFNICAALLNGDTAPHLKLYRMHPVGEVPPHDAVANAQVLGRRLDLTVTIAGYGSGRLSFVVVG